MTIEKITPGRGTPERYFIKNEDGTTLAWRRQNPDKVKQQRERYWNRQAEKMRKEGDESGKGSSRD